MIRKGFGVYSPIFIVKNPKIVLIIIKASKP